MDEFWKALGENPWALWAGAALALGAAELASLDMVLLMLAIGALAGLVTSVFTGLVVVQILVAVATSVAMLAFVRPGVLRRLHAGPELRQGVAALVGQEGFAVAEVSSRSGQIKLAGEIWTARPYDESEVIAPGAKVQVLEIRGATAYVHEVPELGS